MTIYPKLTSPKTSPFTRSYDRAGGFDQVSNAPYVRSILPYYEASNLKPGQPRRKAMKVPRDDGSFVKPIKQCFVRNPRLMSMTRIMLILLTGWNGRGGVIETTTGTIARNLSRSRRMVFNYLQDAMEQGYLVYTRKKDRMGYYVGIRITLNTNAIRRKFQKRKPIKDEPKMAEIRDVKLNADTNYNSIINRDSDKEIMKTLAKIAVNIGYIKPEKHLPDR